MSNLLQQSFSTAISIVSFPFVGALVVGTKFAYLVPLLVRWNESSNPQSAFLGSWKVEDLVACTGNKGYNDAPISRVGIHQVAVHDKDIARQILKGDVKIVERRQQRRSVISRSNMFLGGFNIPAGTLIEFDISAEEC